jgi:hypothetical protein
MYKREYSSSQHKFQRHQRQSPGAAKSRSCVPGFTVLPGRRARGSLGAKPHARNSPGVPLHFPHPVDVPPTPTRPNRAGNSDETAAEESRKTAVTRPQSVPTPSQKPTVEGNRKSHREGTNVSRWAARQGDDSNRRSRRGVEATVPSAPHVVRNHQRPRYRAEGASDDVAAIRPDERDSGPPIASRGSASRSASATTSDCSASVSRRQQSASRASSVSPVDDSAGFASVPDVVASEFALPRDGNPCFLGEFTGSSNPAPATEFERTLGFPGVFSFPEGWAVQFRT